MERSPVTSRKFIDAPAAMVNLAGFFVLGFGMPDNSLIKLSIASSV